MRHQWLRRLWNGIHEPRIVTITMTALYLIMTTVGILLIVGGLPTIIYRPLVEVEAGLLVVFGSIGAGSALAGRWWIERIAVAAITGTGALLVLAPVLAAANARAPEPAFYASWLIGMACWLAIGITRWAYMSDSAYAPGRGPMTAEQRSRSTDRHVQQVEDTIAARQTKPEV